MNLIIEEIRKGNRKVFKTFFYKNYEELVVFANNYLYNQQASEDIVQEVFIYLWENANNITIRSSLKAYVYVMVKKSLCVCYGKK